MTDDKLTERLDYTDKCLEVIAESIANQHALNIRLEAHVQAHLAAIREHLVQLGEDRTMLRQRLQSSYESAFHLYDGQLQSFLESGDIKSLLSSPIFPDEIQGN